MHKSDGPRTTGQSDGPYNFCGIYSAHQQKWPQYKIYFRHTLRRGQYVEFQSTSRERRTVIKIVYQPSQIRVGIVSETFRQAPPITVTHPV